MDALGGITVVLGFAACFGGFIALIVILSVNARRRERERQDALYRWSVANEWRLTFHPANRWTHRLPGNNKRGVSLALNGTLGNRHVAVGEYSYTTSSYNGTTTTTTTHNFVITVVWLSRPSPSMGIHRRGVFSWIGRSMFGSRRGSVGYEPFDSQYVITGDPRLPVNVPRQLVAEQAQGRLPDWSVEGQELLAYRTGRIGDPNTIPAQLGPVLHIAALIQPP